MGKVTLQSIADEVGVSRMTVSNAFSRPEKLSADLRERILAVALARGRTGTVGLLITGRLSEQASDPVATEFLVAVADALSDHGLALTLITAGVGGETVPARDVPMDGALVYVCEPDSTDLAWLRRRDPVDPRSTSTTGPVPGPRPSTSSTSVTAGSACSTCTRSRRTPPSPPPWTRPGTRPPPSATPGGARRCPPRGSSRPSSWPRSVR